MRTGFTRFGGTSRSIVLIVFALALGYFVPHIRDRWLPDLGTDMGRDQLISFLEALATGMMTFTGLVLSLLFVLLDLGASGYTPRIASSWVKDPRIMNATGVFTGTFVFALMALRGIELTQGSRSCALTTYVAFAWLLASLWMLTRLRVVFMEHDHTHIMRTLGQHGSDAIDAVYGAAYTSSPAAPLPEGDPVQVIQHSGPPLYIVRMEVDRLVELAREYDAIIRLPFSQGDSISDGAVLALVYGRRSVPPERFRRSIELGLERDARIDPKYALRLLVDVAVRAESAAINDPTTAVQALDQIEPMLIKLGNLDLDVGRVHDRDGALRVVYDAATWEEYLELALVETQYYGARSLQTERRIAALLDYVRKRVPEPRRAAVKRLVEQHDAVVAHALDGPPLVVAAGSDRQGLGHTLQ
jgi:uncharacterized membrane protein